MIRGLHMKLMLIMVLLVTVLMAVVGAFLINSVSRFYLNDFYGQMAEIFGDQAGIMRDLSTAKTSEKNEVEGLKEVLTANMGVLGVDGRNRNYFILDGETGAYLGGSNEELGDKLEITPNILTALKDPALPGFQSDISAKEMDVAIPVERGGTAYVVYIMDNRQTVQELTGEMFLLIIEALGIGLIISILLSFLLSKTMVIPIQRLTESAKQMAEGDFSHNIAIDSQDEIGVLTQAFNNMGQQLEETLQDVKNERIKLDALFLHMTDGVVAFNRKGQIIHANPTAEAMLSQQIPIGGTVNYEKLFADIMPIETVLAVEGRSLAADILQGERFLHLLFAPFSREEQAGILVVIHDVTQQMKTEEMRREFVANVSHELRTPLTNIRSYAETLVSAKDMQEDMREQFLQVILNESN